MKNSHENKNADNDDSGRTAFDRSSMTPRRWLRTAAWRKRALAREHYRGLDTVAREGISDEDYATTMATLETMARNLGWDESQGMPRRGPGGWRGHRHDRGFGPGHGHGHGRGRRHHHGSCHENHDGRENV